MKNFRLQKFSKIPEIYQTKKKTELIVKIQLLRFTRDDKKFSDLNWTLKYKNNSKKNRSICNYMEKRL